MTLTKAQAEIGKDTHRFRVICVGRRGGKTTLAVEEIKGKALAKPRRIAYIAPTYQQARDIAWEALKKELASVITSTNESRLEIRMRTVTGGESLIVLRGWEAIENLRGQAFDFIVIDEVAMMRGFWVNWREVIRPTLTDTRGEVMFISTPKGFNHFYDLYNLEAQDHSFKSFHFTSYDNPHIPLEEIDTARTQMTEDSFAQEYLADFRKTEGLVYKEFDRSKHLYTREDIESSGILLGVDGGFVNPAAVLTIAQDYDNHFWVKSEWYCTKKTDQEIAEYVAGLHGNRVYPDPENQGLIEELKRRAVNVRDVVKGKGSVASGIQKVRELFRQNRLHIHQSCLNLIWELETYSYPDKKDAHNLDENPIKENDHALDALRYALMMQEDFSERKVARRFVPAL